MFTSHCGDGDILCVRAADGLLLGLLRSDSEEGLTMQNSLRISFFALVLASLGGMAAVTLSPFFGWGDGRHVAIFVGTYVIMVTGVTLYNHRYITHNSYAFTRLGRFTARPLLAWAAAISWQGPSAWWRKVHQKHHAHSDTPEDPHSPLRGFWYAHFGWLLKGEISWKLDPKDALPHGKFERALSLPWVYLLVGPGSGLLVSFLLGSWMGASAYLAAVFCGTCLATWSINSVCHLAKERSAQTNDHSRNVYWLAPLSGGEALHFEHHRGQRLSCFAHRRWQVCFDTGFWVLSVLRLFRFVGPLKMPRFN
ncbi:MAG: acyl-CoA desaturase [Candidatus Andersenbacteria bacterium]